MKYLFFDIDGTLIGKSRHVTELNKQAIRQARQSGHKAFLCTGRAPTSVDQELKDIGFDGMICSAGGFVIVDDEYIYENSINQYLLSSIMTLFINNKIYFNVETKDAIYETASILNNIKNVDVNLELERQKRREKENRLPINKLDILNTSVTKICFVSPKKKYFERCRKYIEDYFNIVIFSSDEDEFINGELIIKNCTKADGIIKILNYFNGRMEDTIAFGDSMNDYEMIKLVNTGIVYENSKDILKKEADYFFEEPDQDGIYKIMKQLNLLS